MDTAAGYDAGRDWEGNRVERPIIAVQLPTATTAETSGATLSKYAIDGIHFILECADALARGQGREFLPVVINLSYGVTSGLHHGSSSPVPLERVIDAIVAARKARFGKKSLEIVLPAGNSHLSRCYAEVSFEKKAPKGRAFRRPRKRVTASKIDESAVALRWRILPDDRTPSFLDISLPLRRDGGTSDRITLTVTPPGEAEILPPIGEDPSTIYQSEPGPSPRCTVQYVAQDLSLADPARFRITLLATANHDPAATVAVPGIWTITLRNHELEPTDAVDAVIQRDDTPYGYPQHGRQSYFDHACYRRFGHDGREIEEDDGPNCIVRRRGLLNAIARGDGPVVLGGYIRKQDVAAGYSAGGPTRSANRPSPDAMCASEDSRVHRGILAAGSRSGSVVAMGGTSIAAPRATRRIAKWLSEGKEGDRDRIQQKARDSETPQRPPKPPAERSGAGRIPLDQVINIKRFEE
jgi:hypothetical protein